MNSIKINQSDLLKGLSIVGRAVSTKTTLPILNNILLTFQDLTLTLFATDLEIGIQTKVLAEISQGFSTTVPAKLLTDLINTMTNQILELQYDDLKEVLTVIGVKSKHNIHCLNAKDFPDAPKVLNESALTLDATLFKASISRILFSASEEDTKPVLNSVIFSIEDNQVVIYATDGFRASLRTISIPGQESRGSLYDDKVNIPSSAVVEMARIAEDFVDFYFTGNTAIMTCGDTLIFSQLVSGKAPDYKLINTFIDGVQSTILTLNTIDLFTVCRQANLFATKDEMHSLTLEVLETGLNIKANAKEVGDADCFIDAIVEGNPMTLDVNSDYLRQFLEAAKTPTIKIFMESSKRPIVFRMDDLPGYWHMIMPIAR